MYLVNDIIAFLAANLILSQALGTSTLFVAADSKRKLVGTACCITIFTTFGSAGAFVIRKLLPSEYSDITLLLYILMIGALYVGLLTAAYFINRERFANIRKYIHLSAFNCAVIGTLFTMDQKAANDPALFTMKEYVRFGFEAGIGFITAALILTAAFRKLNSSKVPSSFRGGPAILIYLGIISMAVYSLK